MTTLLAKTPLPNGSSWTRRHNDAAVQPHYGHEKALVQLIDGLAEYEQAHRAMFDDGVAFDGVLGPAWQSIAQGVLELLNGELGRLDGGTLDKVVRQSAVLAGFDDEVS